MGRARPTGEVIDSILGALQSDHHCESKLGGRSPLLLQLNLYCTHVTIARYARYSGSLLASAINAAAISAAGI